MTDDDSDRDLPKLDEVRKALSKLRATDPAKSEVDAFRRIRFINRDGRKVKTFSPNDPSKVTGEKLLSEAVASVFAQHGVNVDHEDLKAKREQHARDQGRRAQGLPDLCDGCAKPLVMTPRPVRTRDLRGHPWNCPSCLRRQRVPHEVQHARCASCGGELGQARAAVRRRRMTTPPWFCPPCSRRRSEPCPVSVCIQCGLALPNGNGSSQRRQKGLTTGMCLHCSSLRIGAQSRKYPKDEVHSCAMCGTALSMKGGAAASRRQRPMTEWRCRSCCDRGRPAALDANSVSKIKRMLRDGASRSDVAERFGVSKTTIHLIARGKTWKTVS